VEETGGWLTLTFSYPQITQITQITQRGRAATKVEMDCTQPHSCGFPEGLLDQPFTAG